MGQARMNNPETLAAFGHTRHKTKQNKKQTNRAKQNTEHITDVQHGLHRKSGFNPGAKILL